MGTGWFRIMIFSIVLSIMFTWFALSNSQVVSVSLFLWTKSVSLSIVILVSLLIGVIFAGIIAVIEQTKMLAKLKELEKKLKHDEEILHGQSDTKSY